MSISPPAYTTYTALLASSLIYCGIVGRKRKLISPIGSPATPRALRSLRASPARRSEPASRGGRCWHICDVPTASSDVPFQGQPGRHVLMLSSSQFDPLTNFALLWFRCKNQEL